MVLLCQNTSKKLVHKRDEIVLKRELYVAMTGPKIRKIFMLFYSYTERDQELAHIISDISINFKNKKLMKRKNYFRT